MRGVGRVAVNPAEYPFQAFSDRQDPPESIPGHGFVCASENVHVAIWRMNQYILRHPTEEVVLYDLSKPDRRTKHGARIICRGKGVPVPLT